MFSGLSRPLAATVWVQGCHQTRGAKARFPSIFAHSPSWRGPLPSSMPNQPLFLLLAAAARKDLGVLRDLSKGYLPLSPRGTTSLFDIAWSWGMGNVGDGQRRNVDHVEKT